MWKQFLLQGHPKAPIPKQYFIPTSAKKCPSAGGFSLPDPPKLPARKKCCSQTTLMHHASCSQISSSIFWKQCCSKQQGIAAICCCSCCTRGGLPPPGANQSCCCLGGVDPPQACDLLLLGGVYPPQRKPLLLQLWGGGSTPLLCSWLAPGYSLNFFRASRGDWHDWVLAGWKWLLDASSYGPAALRFVQELEDRSRRDSRSAQSTKWISKPRCAQRGQTWVPEMIPKNMSAILLTPLWWTVPASLRLHPCGRSDDCSQSPK